jgi:hypothetical protein
VYVARDQNIDMPRTNYSFEKRQRDLAKKAKKDEKRKRKLENKPSDGDSKPSDSAQETPAV